MQCESKSVCIFPYDGMTRIRFAGENAFIRSISAGTVRLPEE